ncbi:MAG: MerR family transcriptional regulator [Thomasclavelia sp.]|nr:MerR family transcriptional regulator [Thomasclavelia sp.]
MKYTTKDVCKIYDITRDTLRYYEKVGIIHPEIDKTNNYRYYDDWDINYLGECKKYQSLGFTIKEITKIFKDGTLEEMINLTQSKQKDFTNKLRFYELLVKYNDQYIGKLKSIETNLNQFSIVDTNNRYIIPNREKFEYKLDDKILDSFHDTLKEYSFYDNTVLIKLDDYKANNGIFLWGNSIASTFVPYVSTSTKNMYLLPGHKCLYTIIDAGERWNFSYKLFDNAIKYINKHNYTICGDIYGNLLTRVYDEEKFCRYIEVYIPIE